MNVNKAYRESFLKTSIRDTLGNGIDDLPVQAHIPKIQLPELTTIEDTVDISTEAKNKTSDFRKMLDDMRSEMQALRERLQQAREAGEGAAAAWKEKIKLLRIAMRIMSGDKVPVEDHRFLMERDAELYSRAIKMRMEKDDPKEYDRLSEDEKVGDDVAEGSPAVAMSAAVGVQPSEVTMPKTEV